MYSVPPEKWDLLLQLGDYYGISSRLDHHYLSIAWANEVMQLIPKEYKSLLVIGADYDEVKTFQTLGYTVRGFGIQENTYPDIEYDRGDMHNLPYKAGSFDAVVSRGTFEHGHAPWLQALEIRRVLRDFGRVYLEVPKWDSPELGVARTDFHHPMVLHPIHLKTIFAKLGFVRLREIGDICYWWEKLPVALMPVEPRFKDVIKKYEGL